MFFFFIKIKDILMIKLLGTLNVQRRYFYFDGRYCEKLYIFDFLLIFLIKLEKNTVMCKSPI